LDNLNQIRPLLENNLRQSFAGFIPVWL